MKAEDVEALISRARIQPKSTALVIVVLTAAIAGGSWLASFFGELGKRHAGEKTAQPTEATKESTDTAVDNAPSITVEADHTPKPGLDADVGKVRAQETLRKNLHQILKNQQRILQRIKDLEERLSSSTKQASETTVDDLDELIEAYEKLISLVAYDSPFQIAINTLSDMPSTTKAPETIEIWQRQRRMFKELQHTIAENRVYAQRLARELKLQKELIPTLISIEAYKDAFDQLKALMSEMKSFSQGMQNLISALYTTLPEESQ